MADAREPGSPWVEVFLDDAPTPVAAFRPPQTFQLDTTALPDGEHVLRIEATDVTGHKSIERRRFRVRNGPGIAISGLREGETIKGRLPILVNAYAFEKVRHFEVKRAETPVPIPWLYGVGVLAFVAWGLWYLIETWNPPVAASAVASAAPATGPGASLFAANCAACHQAGGTGVPGVFPALKANPLVNSADASGMLIVMLNGLQGQAINGVSYPGQMPAFKSQLDDNAIAAIATYVRSSWGNHAGPVTAAQVTAQRH